MGTSDEQKISEWHKCAIEGRKRALRREKYLSCFAVFVVVICLALIACVVSLIVLGAVELTHYLWRPEFSSGLFWKKKKRKANLPFMTNPKGNPLYGLISLP